MKNRKVAQELCERLDLPAEAAGASKLTVIGGRQALVENHRGLLEYGEELIRVKLDAGELVLRGSELRLTVMTGKELLIRGRLLAAEWEEQHEKT